MCDIRILPKSIVDNIVINVVAIDSGIHSVFSLSDSSAW